MLKILLLISFIFVFFVFCINKLKEAKNERERYTVDYNIWRNCVQPGFRNK